MRRTVVLTIAEVSVEFDIGLRHGFATVMLVKRAFPVLTKLASIALVHRQHLDHGLGQCRWVIERHEMTVTAIGDQFARTLTVRRNHW